MLFVVDGKCSLKHVLPGSLNGLYQLLHMAVHLCGETPELALSLCQRLGHNTAKKTTISNGNIGARHIRNITSLSHRDAWFHEYFNMKSPRNCILYMIYIYKLDLLRGFKKMCDSLGITGSVTNLFEVSQYHSTTLVWIHCLLCVRNFIKLE